MRTQELEKDTYEPPVINSWRSMPSPAQIRYATNLCRSELPYAERVATIASFPALDGRAMSELIDTLRGLRDKRMARLRRTRRRRR